MSKLGRPSKCDFDSITRCNQRSCEGPVKESSTAWRLLASPFVFDGPFGVVLPSLTLPRFILSIGENFLCWILTWDDARVTYRLTISRVVCPRICWSEKTSPPFIR